MKWLIAPILAMIFAMPYPAASAPSPVDSCSLSAAEQKEVDATKALLAAPIPFGDFHDVGGCAVVSLEVSRAGVVKSALVRRKAISGVRVWQNLAMRTSFKRQASDWKGLIRFRVLENADS